MLTAIGLAFEELQTTMLINELYGWWNWSYDVFDLCHRYKSSSSLESHIPVLYYVGPKQFKIWQYWQLVRIT